MKSEAAVSTRRSFLKFGAMLAAPFAAAAPAAAASLGDDDTAARLARLEAMNAIRDVHGAYVRAVNAGAHAQAASLFADPKTAALDAAVRHLTADASQGETLDLAEDGQSATLKIAMTVKTETPIDCDSTIVQMARLQGDGVIRHTAPRTLQTAFVKTEAGWKIAQASLV